MQSDALIAISKFNKTKVILDSREHIQPTRTSLSWATLSPSVKQWSAPDFSAALAALPVYTPYYFHPVAFRETILTPAHRRLMMFASLFPRRTVPVPHKPFKWVWDLFQLPGIPGELFPFVQPSPGPLNGSLSRQAARLSETARVHKLNYCLTFMPSLQVPVC